jgi:hypothetical protein
MVNRHYIKRGKKLAVMPEIFSYLKTNDKISPLLPTIQRNLRLQRECETILPTLFKYCEILGLANEELVLATQNASIASKLKQQVPKLQYQLESKGWSVRSVKIKVQVHRKVEKAVPVKTAVLSNTAVSAFAELERSLEKTVSNEGLKLALHRLLKRNQPPE